MNISKRNLIIAFGLICILSGTIVGSLIYVYASGSMTNATFEAGTQTETATWVVWHEGSTYYAKNGSTGAITHTSSNATDLFEDLMDDSDNGAEIFCQNGQYDIDSTIVVRESGIYFRGEDMGHHTSGTRPRSGTVFRLTTSGIPMFQWGNSTTSVQSYFGGISDMHLYGQSDNSITGADAVYISGGATDLVFEWVFIDLFADDGFVITAHEAKTWNIFIVDCLVESCDVGINVTDTMAYDTPPIDYDVYDWTTRVIDRVNVIRCHTWGNRRDVDISAPEGHNMLFTESQFYGAEGDAIHISNESRRIQIIGNRIYDWGRDGDNLYDGIHIIDNVFDVLITGNIMGDHWEDGDRYSVHLEESCRDIQIYDNDFAVEGETQIVVSSTGARIFIHDNKGYITECAGNATVSNDDWVSFGLTMAGTPQTITVSVNATDSNYVAQVKSMNTTHFQLYLYDLTADVPEGVDKSIMWSAFYTP